MRTILTLAIAILAASAELYAQVPLNLSARGSTELDGFVRVIRVEPIVIREGMDTFAFEVETIPQVNSPFGQISDVTIGFDGNPGQVLFDGESVGDKAFRLNDEGVAGDAVAGDGIFSLGGFTSFRREDSIPWDATTIWAQEVGVEFENGERRSHAPGERFMLPVAARVIDPTVVDPVVAEMRGDSIQFTDHAVVLITDELLGSNWIARKFGTESTDSFIRDGLTEAFYRFFPDDFDFIVRDHVVGSGLCWDADCHAFTGGSFGIIKNRIEGIGTYDGGVTDGTHVDNSARFGSSGRLKGLLNVNAGFSAYGSNFFVHELSHYWLAHRGLAEFEPALADAATSHWRNTAALDHSGFGQNLVDYASFEDLGNGTFRAWHAETAKWDEVATYNDFELYLMGAVAPNDVEPFQVLQNATVVSRAALADVYEASGIRSIAVEDVVAALGPRVPAFPDAQTDFRGVWLVAYDRPLTPVEVAYYSLISRSMSLADNPHGTSPGEASGGRITFSTSLSGSTETRTAREPESVPLRAEVYPNPTNADLRLRWRVEEPGPVRVTLYDLLGRPLGVLHDATVPPGETEINVDTARLSAGVYYLVLEHNEISTTGAFLRVQ